MISNVWQSWCIAIGDGVFGPLLYAPRGLAIVVLALTSAALLVAVRVLVLHSDRARAVRDDLRTLRKNQQAARAAGSPEWQRWCRIRARVAQQRLMMELRVAATSFIPLAINITWASARLPHRPCLPGEPFVLHLQLPASDAGQLVHLVPLEPLEVAHGWMRNVERVSVAGDTFGSASWTLHSRAPAQGMLQIRTPHGTLSHDFRVGFGPAASERIDHGYGMETWIPWPRFGIGPWSRQPPLEHIPWWFAVYLVETWILWLALRALLHIA